MIPGPERTQNSRSDNGRQALYFSHIDESQRA